MSTAGGGHLLENIWYVYFTNFLYQLNIRLCQKLILNKSEVRKKSVLTEIEHAQMYMHIPYTTVPCNHENHSVIQKVTYLKIVKYLFGPNERYGSKSFD